MDSESYENPDIATIINDQFVAVKVDRDERPDVDARYQSAVNAISGQGGWPLTAFLLPDGRPFYGGTYFPPTDRYGRPGFIKVLQAIADLFKTEPTKAVQNAAEVERFLTQHLSRSGEKLELTDSLVDTALSVISRNHDIRHGGFGTAPKFPHPGVIELLLRRYLATGERWMLDAINGTLTSMARGGIYDQLAGGFHRYSTDERWIVPHFEKMLYDNASLLVNYVHAAQATGNQFFRHIALDIIRYVDEVLSDRTAGGFYASQDADVAPGDDGSYFTWTTDDAKKVLTSEELEVLSLHFNIDERGEMHHDPRQNVLFVDKTAEQIAEILHKPLDDVQEKIETGKAKLLKARTLRKPPFVDRSIYASWNGMMIQAYLEAFKAFGISRHRDFALLSLDRILREHRQPNGLLSHRAGASETFLDDQIEITNALLTAFEVTGEIRYWIEAEEIVQKTIELFWDQDTENETGHSAFNDLPSTSASVGALSLPYKPVTDSPTPGANAVAALLLLKLYTVTEKKRYLNLAESILNYFSGIAATQGIFAGTLVLAIDSYLHPSTHVVVATDKGDDRGNELLNVALRTFVSQKIVTIANEGTATILPASVRQHIKAKEKPFALVCSNFSCSMPVRSADELEKLLLHGSAVGV